MENAEKEIMKQIRSKTGLSQKRFGKKYGIPERTIQDWETGKRKPTEYVMKMLNKCVEGEKLAPMSYVFEKYRDKAGVGNVKCFRTVEKALQEASDDWNRMNDHDKESFLTDPAGRFDVTLRRMTWDDVDDEWIPEADDIMGIWDYLKDEQED